MFLNYFFEFIFTLRCCSLSYANFSYCEHVTDAGIELLASLPSLISLDISGCNISDIGIVALGNNPNFRDLNISECCGVTDIGLQKLFPQIKGLENLDLSHLNVRKFIFLYINCDSTKPWKWSIQISRAYYFLFREKNSKV